MTNGARHGLGVLAGIVAIPVLIGLFGYAADRYTRWRSMALYSYRMHESTGVAVVLIVLLLLSAALLAVLCAPRLSPLASLVPGAALLIVNVVFLFKPRWTYDLLLKPMSPRWVMAFTDQLASGMLVLAGGLLIAASVAPSRWRGRTAPMMAGPGAYGPGLPHPGMGGPGMPGGPRPGASPGPFGQPQGYPSGPPQTPPSAPPPA
ncbi:hypothetical protein [Actinomadura rupiterrae]|uniref:hypothetical protein n=1 Tax=Actinomadura rupiterrae TaxID=559627 RepID=UPI0020A3F4A3|nr:hypothetical protein [Actinomadura rupiterrae]MCP2335377.1 hypothetical protein [Actinomadura rupiterrae]